MYIYNKKSVRIFAMVLAVVITMLVATVPGLAAAIPERDDLYDEEPLPTQPPVVDSMPVPHTGDTRQTETKPLVGVGGHPQSGASAGDDGLPVTDTGTVLLLGLAIWYLVTLVGFVGGRRGRRRSNRL